MGDRSLATRLWRALGIVGARDAAARTERIDKRLQRLDKRLDHVVGTLDAQQRERSAIAASLDELKTAIARLQQTLDDTSAQVAAVARARKDDLQAADAVPQLSARLERMAAAVDAHLEHALARVTVSPEPFPHVIIEDLLPAECYDLLIEMLPPPGYWRFTGRGRDNWEIETDAGPWRTELVWRFADRRIMNDLLRPRLERAFAGHLARLWREAFDLDPSAVRLHVDEGRLQLRRKGYRLRAHLDPPHAALTGLMYLACPGDDSSYGTTIYKASSPIPVKRQGIYYPEDHGIALEAVATVPFRANSLLVWMTALGPHGADLTAATIPKSLERYTYQFQIVTDAATRRRIKAR